VSRNVGDNGIVPIASRYDPDMGVIIEVYDGDVAFDEWHDHIAAIGYRRDSAAASRSPFRTSDIRCGSRHS